MMKNAYTRTNRLIGDSPKDKPGFSETVKSSIGYNSPITPVETGFIGERITAENKLINLQYGYILKSNLLGGRS
jgi:hypothetical protein